MNVREILGKKRLFLDGGTGTSLQKMGLKAGERPETWNILHPERIEPAPRVPRRVCGHHIHQHLRRQPAQVPGGRRIFA